MSPKELAELYRTALSQTDDEARARRMIEAHLAGRDGLLPVDRAFETNRRRFAAGLSLEAI